MGRYHFASEEGRKITLQGEIKPCIQYSWASVFMDRNFGFCQMHNFTVTVNYGYCENAITNVYVEWICTNDKF